MVTHVFLQRWHASFILDVIEAKNNVILFIDPENLLVKDQLKTKIRVNKCIFARTLMFILLILTKHEVDQMRSCEDMIIPNIPRWI